MRQGEERLAAAQAALATAQAEAFSVIVEARATAVSALAALECDGKADSAAYFAAMNLDSDMQRLMHGTFEA